MSDANNALRQRDFIQYLRDHSVLVVTMAPKCRSFGPTSQLNRLINYETWNDHYVEDRKDANFCGHVAEVHMQHSRYFFGEQPNPTTLWQEHPWPLVVQHPTVIRKVIDQGMLDNRAPNGQFVKKTTVLISNSETILAQFDDLRCNGQHSHYQPCGSSRTDDMKIWPWKLAE